MNVKEPFARRQRLMTTEAINAALTVAWQEVGSVMAGRTIDPEYDLTDEMQDAASGVLWPVLAAFIDALPADVLAAESAGGDEHHTLDELYDYRMLYNAHAANLWAEHGTYPVVKSWRHHDGEACFGGGWFIVSVQLPSGQASNHYPAKNWDHFKVPVVELAPEWDGHTPAEAAERLRSAL